MDTKITINQKVGLMDTKITINQKVGLMDICHDYNTPTLLSHTFLRISPGKTIITVGGAA